jgi:hypothetical protein
MLARSAASFVFVYSPEQIGVVSASAVEAMRVKPAHNKTHTELGTKRLDDFFVHLADSFIGDRSITAADREGVRALAGRNFARSGLFLSVTDTQAVQ